MDYKAQVQLTPDDFMAWLRYYFLWIPQGRRRALFFLSGVMLAYFLFVVLEYRHDAYDGPFIVYVLSTVALLALALFVLGWAVTSPLTQIMLKFTARKVLLEPISYFFTVEDIRVVSESGQGRIPWKLIRAWEASSRHVFLHLGGLSVVILPREQLPDVEALHELVISRLREPHTQ